MSELQRSVTYGTLRPATERTSPDSDHGRLTAPEFSIRVGTADDNGFIAKSWLETLRASHEARAIDSAIFSRHHSRIISNVLRRQSVTVRIAHPADSDFEILGFAVLAPGKIHFVYVRKAFRKFGIAKKLCEGIDVKGSLFGTWSPDVQHWILEKYRGLRYQPNWAEVEEHGTETRVA